MFELADVVGLYAETPLHPGASASGGAIDLPVQRERHTGLPLLQSTSLKGVLRDYAEKKFPKDSGEESEKILEVFGPNIGGGDAHGGALSPTDGRILLFPARSLQGIFVWVTAPMVIERFYRDLKLAGKADKVWSIDVDPSEAKVGGNSQLRSPFVLEEEEYTIKEKNNAVDELAECIKALMPSDQRVYDPYIKRLSTYLAVVSNDDFQRIVTVGTDIVTRIRLNERKTTDDGGNMWVEEFLPSDCLFYTLLLAMSSRKAKPDPLDAKRVMEFVKGIVNLEVIQVGADESVGRGWMRVSFWK